MRPAQAFRYEVPTRCDVERRLHDLVNGSATRAEVASWAIEFIVYDDPQVYPKVSDSAVWRALQQLSGADLPTTDREYLHDENDFAAWLAELRDTR